GQPANEAGPVQLVEGSRSEPVPEDVSVRIEYPRPNALSPDSLAEADIEVEGLQLRDPTPKEDRRGIAVSERGQHVHFVVDNAPYVAVYDESEAIDLSGLETGAHVLRAFAARSWHESVKTEDAFAIRKFYVNDTVPEVEWKRDTPLLTYSRPKGLYRGSDADSVMVDFFVTNAELGSDAHAVRLTVDDSLVYTLEEWKPYYLLGLDSGEHTVKLDLLGPDGTVVPGPFSTTERVITVVRDTVSEGPMQ
ncbi:MAG: hypothetical protein ABEJ46_00120, partial [Gemmatimonadota bacterium]